MRSPRYALGYRRGAIRRHARPVRPPSGSIGAWFELQPYDEALPALRALRDAASACCVLTNGTPATAQRRSPTPGSPMLLDVTLSVEAAGVFKPDPRVYALATAHYGVDAGAARCSSRSNGWDATGAARSACASRGATAPARRPKRSGRRRLPRSADLTTLAAADRRRRSRLRAQSRAAGPDDGVIRVLREKRRASAVTLVHGLPPNEIEPVGKELRRRCGTGGTAKNGVVELQGDHRDAVVAYLHRTQAGGSRKPAAKSGPLQA